MKVIKPIEIVDSKLLSSNVEETDYPEWVSGTTYSQGARVIRASIHKVYERLLTGSGNVAPENDTTNWVFVSYTNRWKMFDQKGGSVTTNATLIDVTIKPSAVVNTLCLLGLDASSVQVIVTDPVEGVVFDETRQLLAYYGVTNWWRWFFEPLTRPSALFIAIPPYPNATVRVKINATATAKVGSLLLGTATYLGDAQYGTSVGVTSYSIKERDKFGNISIVPRAYADKARYALKIHPERTDYVKRFLTGVRDIPCVYIGEDEEEATFVYGFYKELDLVYTSFAYSDYSLEVEGLV